MPGITIPVGAKADDRSFRALGEQAERFFRSVGRDSASAFTKDFADAVNNSSPQVQKSFDKIRDSIGQVAAAQARLSELQSKGASNAQLIAQSERLEKAKRAESRAINDARQAYEGAGRSVGALQNALQGLVSGSLTANIPYLNASHINAAADAFGAISNKALLATTGVAGVGIAVAAVGKQLYDLGVEWDDVADSITGRTGIMGDQLDGIVNSVKQVGQQSALSFSEIGQHASGVAQSLHLTGDAATYMTQKLSDIQQVTGQQVDERGLGKAFRLFDVNGVQSQVDSLNQLLAASQATEIPINELVNQLSTTGKAGKEAGLGLQQTIGMILTLEDAGVSFERAGPSLAIALKNWANSGQDANKALADTVTQIKALIDAGNSPGALKLAQQTFGRGYIDFFNAIKDGTLNVQSFTDALNKLGDTSGLIDKQKQSTQDWHEQWKMLTNTLKEKLEPTASKVFAGINAFLENATGNFNNFRSAEDNARASLERLASVPIDPNSALGKMLLPAGPAGSGPQGQPPPMAGSALGQSPTIPLPPQTDWITGQQRVWDPKTRSYVDPFKTGSGGGPKLPDAPVVPYDTTLPSITAGLPQTSEILGAENAYMDARHTLAEKQARVNQLEHDNNAKADDIQKAKNDVVNAQQAQDQAELRLYDARQSLYEKNTKQVDKQVKDLGDIGAQLDSDFGITKGLAGIADNLTRFLANLFAAPLLGQLAAVRDANPSQGGYGLMGVLGAQGAFGPQFTGIDTSKQPTASKLGPAYFQPGGQVSYMPSAAALPGESARDFAHRVMMPYWQGQGFQVGDHAADQFGEHQHGALDIMVNSLAQGQQVLQQVLSDPNVYGAIFNNQTFGYGHGLTPQDYTAGHTGNPTQDHQDHVHAWYKPGDPNDIRPAGAMPGGVSPVGSGSFGGGSFPIPLPVTIVGGGLSSGGAPLGSPASGRGLGPAPGPGGLSPQQWQQIAGAEASGNWQANTGNGFSGGLQFTPETWNAFGGQQYAPQAWQATPEQQMAIGNNVLAGQGPGAWPATSAAHPEWFQPGLPSVPAGFGGQGYSGLGGPGVGAAVGATQIGGVPPPAGTGSGGVGLTPGGSVDTALGLAAGGLDLLAPGAGQAAQTGIKLANRAIQYAGQVAGIGVEGLMQTFLPSGSDLANKSWLVRIAGGLAGAAPALPNLAGKAAAAANQPPPGSPASGQGSGPAPGPQYQINVTNNRATEDGTGRDIVNNLQANQYVMPGVR